MTSFGWKRKVGAKVSKEASTSFVQDVREEGNDDVDWLNLIPKNKSLRLEDNIGKSLRLKREGVTLAESERFWEAIRKWDEAIFLTPTDATLYEMKAQALMGLNELFPALTMANKVTELDPIWWVGYQTLGRAHLNMGEVKMAVNNFCKAIHLNPGEKELWDEDLKWACELLARQTEAKMKLKNKTSLTIKEVDVNLEDCDNDENNLPSTSSTVINTNENNKICANILSEKIQSNSEDTSSKIKTIPSNYVHMRDS